MSVRSNHLSAPSRRNIFRNAGNSGSTRSRQFKGSFFRRLQIEYLEDRRLLSANKIQALVSPLIAPPNAAAVLVSPGPFPPDAYEPNDTFATATNLGFLGNISKTGLTIDTAGNDDYYHFTAASTGQATIITSFTNSSGDLTQVRLSSAVQLRPPTRKASPSR